MRHHMKGVSLEAILVLLSGFVGTAGPLAPCAIAQTYLYNRADFPVGNTPSAVISGDFNSDGKPDLAVGNRDDNTVSILLGKPDGSFGPRTDLAIASSPMALAAADFNGDGRLDVAAVGYTCVSFDCSSPSFLSILIGNGDGTFESHFEYQVGGYPLGIVAADFNSDGAVDLAVANNADGTVSVLSANGDGTFQGQTLISDLGYPQMMVGGDFNGDGEQDLMVVNSHVIILLCNGDGTFNRVDTILYPYASNGAVGDFNHDGKLDAIVGFPPQVLLGNGDGTFQPPSPTAIYADFASAECILAGDFNNDSILDLAFTGHGVGAAAAVSLGNGDGTFQFSQFTVPVVSATPLTPAIIEDFNGDGNLDLAEVNPGTNTVDVLLGGGDGTFGYESNFQAAAPLDFAAREVISDFNADGKPDVGVMITGGTTPTISVLLGNGDGTLQNPVSSPIPGTQGYALVADDFNGDGKEDVAIDAGSAVSVFAGNGDGGFQASVSTILEPNLTVERLVCADFNGDGKPDLAAGAYDSNTGQFSVLILAGGGGGAFTGGLSYGFSGFISSLVAADWNEDGKPDLAITQFDDDRVTVLIGNGDGSFQAPATYPVGAGGVIGVGDVNGDGNLDMVLLNGGRTSVLLGNGNGTFQSHIDTVVSTNSLYGLGSLLVADINGDGKKDVGGLGETSADVLLGNGDGTFRSPLAYHPDSTAGSAAASDFNFDGIPDLAIASTLYSGAYPAVSLLLSAPAVSLFPSLLNFGPQPVQVPSATQDVILTNIGNAPLSVSTISTTGDFTQTSSCEILPIAAHCTISVAFTPMSAGMLTGTLLISDSAATSPQLIALSGTGTGPVASLSSSSLEFDGQPVGTTSEAKTVTLSNTGDADLSISSIAVSGDFAETDTCTSPLAPQGSCTIDVTFTPTVAGARSGWLTIADNAAGSPRTVTLSGNGADFSLAAASGSSTSQTVTVGGTATYALSFAPTGGLTGNVALSCTGAPSHSTCTISPTSLTLDGVNAGAATVTVKTTARSLMVPRSPEPPGPLRWPAVWLVVLAMLVAYGAMRRAGVAMRVAPAAVLTATLLLGLLWPACGGGGGGGGGGNAGTPAGTYTLTVTATYTSGTATLTHSLDLTLKVN